MKFYNYYSRILFISILIITLFSSGILLADEIARVLIIPFHIHSDEDLSFLRQGIENMLQTRLAQKDRIIVIDPEKIKHAIQQKNISKPIDDDTAISFSNEFSADYVLTGSLTIFGDNVSTDAKCIDVKTREPVVVYHKLGQNRGDAISHINQFASKINATVFKKDAPLSSIPEPEETTVQPIAPPKLKEDKHPETFWKSPTINTQIKSMAIGDVDGDGSNEAVFASNNIIYIYRYTSGRFEIVREIKEKHYDTIIGVDVADINKNGKAEIFVTNIRKKSNRLISYVLEFNTDEIKTLVKDEPWYYRVLNLPGRGKVLMGQKRGAGGGNLFKAGIFELKWQNGKYEPSDSQPLPKKMNVFSFTYMDVLNNGQEMVIAFTKSDRIMILDKNGNESWTSSERYGGSSTYLEFTSDIYSEKDDGDGMEHYYLPQRIQVADLDKDGQNNMILVSNDELSGRLFSRTRSYKKGYIACYTWDTVGLKEKWKTREISGYISDYTVSDLNNDGRNELVFSIVEKRDGLTGKKKSFIIARNLSK